MNICVFCSCSEVGEPWISDMRKLGHVLGKAGHTLVFGGFGDGLMGAIADGFADAGAPIIGVVPRDLENGGRVAHPMCTEVIETADLAERKAVMIEKADAFIAAPGGIGTLDELFCVLGMVITHEVAAPVIAYDIHGFYGSMFDLLTQMESTGFIRGAVSSALAQAETPHQALEMCGWKSTYRE